MTKQSGGFTSAPKPDYDTDPIRFVQAALSDPDKGLVGMSDALSKVVTEYLWQEGRPFRAFGDFAVSLPPLGLGVRSLSPLELLRWALLKNRYYKQWTEVLLLTAREIGRPRKSIVNDESFERFYTISTASTSRDRLLLSLYRNHVEHFIAVCDHECSLRQAGIEAGLIRPNSRLAVLDLAAARSLPETAQAGLLCDLFAALSVHAQSALLIELEPELGEGLGQRWRHRRGQDETIAWPPTAPVAKSA
jgi:hypothetical protein